MNGWFHIGWHWAPVHRNGELYLDCEDWEAWPYQVRIWSIFALGFGICFAIDWDSYKDRTL